MFGEQLFDEFHAEPFMFRVAFDERRPTGGIRMDDAAQRLRRGNELEREITVSGHGFAGDAVQIAVQVEFEPAFAVCDVRDLLRHVEADAGLRQRRQDGTGEHRPVVLMHEHAVRFTGAQ